MRQLIYVPVIHEQVDLGSAGIAVAQRSVELSGERRWRMHQDTLERYWGNLAAYLRSFDSRRLKLYQDGLAAGGELGRRIAEEAARRGSKNHSLLLALLNSGAELRKTEDPVLLLKEYEYARQATVLHPTGSQPSGAGDDSKDRERLLEQRDRFIAETISSTLEQDEIGVLFIGATHRVLPLLPNDVSLVMAKDPDLVKAYVEELLQGRDDKRFKELADYVSAPVAAAR